VDWLDYLDGFGDPDLGEHLAGCLSCQAVVASLRAETPSTVPSDWAEAFTGRTDAVWQEDRPANPAPAEFWFSAASFELADVIAADKKQGEASRFAYHNANRVLVVVLTHPDDDHIGWIDVVPVLTDIEAATETDFLLTAEENSLGSPWRALFAHQVKVARQQLDTRVGSLSELGASSLWAALSGEVDNTRWGVALQHPDDPRARLDDEVEEALRRLRTPWLLLHAGDGETDEEQTSDENPQPGEHSREPEFQFPEQLERADLFWLAPVSEAQHEYALAAASSPTAPKELWALDHQALQLAGKLSVDWQVGVLIFVISSVRVQHAKRVRLHVVAAGKEYASEPFVPSEATTVPLAEGITTAQVDKLGAEVVP
jgi:hypothetical protein